jgi:hypothetical protein
MRPQTQRTPASIAWVSSFGRLCASDPSYSFSSTLPIPRASRRQQCRRDRLTPRSDRSGTILISGDFPRFGTTAVQKWKLIDFQSVMLKGKWGMGKWEAWPED